MQDFSSTAVTDSFAITRLIQDWGLWRDTGNFDKLRGAYAPGATMRTTWFDGLASDFIDASVRMAGGSTLVQHFIGPCTVEINQDRAVAETRLILMIRGQLADADVDVTCYGRFLDQLVKGDGTWKIKSRVPIYEKDSMQPAVYGDALVIDKAALNSHPKAFRHVAYLQSIGGAKITANIPAHNSEAQRQLYTDLKTWLLDA